MPVAQAMADGRGRMKLSEQIDLVKYGPRHDQDRGMGM
jgi:hypothetical protein